MTPYPPGIPIPAWRPATTSKRVGSALIDMFVLCAGIVAGMIALSTIVGAPGRSEDPASPHSLLFAGLVFAIITFPWAAYFLIGWRMGKTVGMSAMSLRLVSVNGGKPGAGQLLLRLAGAFWSTLLLFFGFFWVGIDSRKRAWHDILSGTRVEERPPLMPMAYSAYGYPPPYGYQPPPGYGPPLGYGPPPAPNAPPPPPSGPVVAEPDVVVDEAAQRGWRSLATSGKSPWTWTDVLPVTALFIPLTLGTGLLNGWIRRQIQPVAPTGLLRGIEYLGLNVLVYSGALLLLFLSVKVRRRASLKQLGIGKVSPRWLIAVIPALAGSYCVALVAGAFSRILFPGTPNNQCTDIRDEFSAYPWVAIGIVAIAAPVVEELFVRGFLLRYLRDRMPQVAAILVSAVIFSAAHFQWNQPTLFLPIFAMGTVLGTLYIYSGSIWPGVLVHGANNLISTLVVLYGTQKC